MGKHFRAPTALIGVIILGLVIGTAAIFSSSSQATAVAQDAALLEQIDEALVAAQAAESSIALLGFVNAAAEAGALSESDQNEVASGTTDRLNELQSLVRAIETIDVTISVPESIADADQSALDSRQLGISRAVATMLNERAALSGRLAAAATSQDRIARSTSFVIAFLIPLGFMLTFRAAANRRNRTARLQGALDKERAISRTKDELIGNLSHELRTPLTGIYGFSMAIDEGPDDPAFMREMNELILTDAADLMRMVEDLLTAAKADSAGLAFACAATDIAEQVDSVVQPFLRQAEVAVEAESGVHALVDRLRFRQVLRNLLSNAIRHGSAPFAVSVENQDDRVVIEVSDHGAGVDPDMKERIFDRFVHDGDHPLLTGSVGLGLSIVRLLTNQMSGEVTYERRGDVTVFRVDFPAATVEELEPVST